MGAGIMDSHANEEGIRPEFTIHDHQHLQPNTTLGQLTLAATPLH